MVEIVTLPPEGWRKYRSIRLQELKEDPEAFGLLFEEAEKFGEEKWREPLEEVEKGENKWMVFAKLGANIVGMMSGQRLGGEDKDMVKVGEVFVAKEARGQGVGKTLLQSLIEQISKDSTVKKLKVKVFTSQEAAIKLYASCGFKTKEEITEHWSDGRTHQTFVMEKHLT